MLTPIILAGGNGTRLWPLSTPSYPKQFLSFSEQRTLLQNTIQRLEYIGLNQHSPIVVCNEEHRFIVAEQLNEHLENLSIILEPCLKNTAAAIAVAALKAVSVDKDAILLVMPADHLIKGLEEFSNTLSKAYEVANEGGLVSIGILPYEANTGFGYIVKGHETGEGCFSIESFIEKPDLERARKLLEKSDCLWNSGLFVVKGNVLLEELKRFRPEIFQYASLSLEHSTIDLDFIRLNKNYFKNISSESIDHAVMENTRLNRVIQASFYWNDLGTWQAFEREYLDNSESNFKKNEPNSVNSKDNLIYVNDRRVTTLGINKTLIVETKNDLLIANKEHLDQLGTVLKDLNLDTQNDNKEVHRPWGKYCLIESGDNFLIKRISVNPKGKISLQKHLKRSEHWVVISGQAHVTRGSSKFTINENESTFIPEGVIHSLENLSNQMLEIIEIQSGKLCSEEDIIRIEDKYGRC